MSFGSTGRFRLGDRQRGLGDVYGSYNVADVTKVLCPFCHEIILVPWGQFDTTHDCTILCPFDSVLMQPIPPDPSTAQIPLVVKTPQDMTEGHWIKYFYYCPSPTCPYYLEHKVGFMQERVQVDLLVGR